MRVAWFRPDVRRPGFDDLGAVIAGLRAAHDVRVVDQSSAHDFVWQWARGHFDLCVYELDDTAAHQYVWPYLLHYPGVLVLRSTSLHTGRSLALIHQRRDADYAAEATFADGGREPRAPWHLVRGASPLWKLPVLASRLTAVGDAALAASITEDCPTARVARPPVGVPDLRAALADHAAAPARAVRVIVGEDGTPGVVERAAERARSAGASLVLAHGEAAEVAAADVVVATRWPAQGRPLSTALLGVAAGRAVIVTETASTAEWPALDPQTWRPRAVLPAPAAPIAISIDPRDEEHSLVLALMRLAGDAGLREALGSAARAWWTAHATVAHAVEAWEQVLSEARRLEPPPRPAGWPPHLDADGSGLTAEILARFGTRVVWT